VTLCDYQMLSLNHSEKILFQFESREIVKEMTSRLRGANQTKTCPSQSVSLYGEI